MKISKTILLALTLGILCLESGFLGIDKTELSQIVMVNSYAGIECYPSYIGEFTMRYIPLFVFQIFFSSYIYQHFCSASVYLFSREMNRGRWIINELVRVCIHAVIYVCGYLTVNIFIIGLFSEIKIDTKGIILLLYHIVIYSLFLISTTIAINILSLRVSGQFGFICVQAIILLSASIIFLAGNYVEYEKISKSNFERLLKSNPIANIMFELHSSKIENIGNDINIESLNFDLNFSVIYFLIIVLALCLVSWKIVKKYEFIINNKEID